MLLDYVSLLWPKAIQLIRINDPNKFFRTSLVLHTLIIYTNKTSHVNLFTWERHNALCTFLHMLSSIVKIILLLYFLFLPVGKTIQRNVCSSYFFLLPDFFLYFCLPWNQAVSSLKSCGIEFKKGRDVISVCNGDQGVHHLLPCLTLFLWSWKLSVSLLKRFKVIQCLQT